MSADPAGGQIWPTAALWDAGIRLGHRLVLPPLPLRPAASGMRLTGPLLRIRHTEGVASILEGLDEAREGDVLFIDNEGRTDEACVGDLVAIEARLAGMAGLVVWGCHRDTDELAVIGLPVFSLGPCPSSPTPRPVGGVDAGRPFPFESGDVAVGDSDGLVVVPAGMHSEVVDVARAIVKAEQLQAEKALGGVSLREQLRWAEFKKHRREDPSYTFRAHLSRVGGALE
ncbi:demethylmenaquinone methyltransferase [Streptomyces inusitatus]|uniref:Putative 4-hydroxy-4-methyl-2-oxoglutarate aldolase n=1 Tax=Streptomyces inusitatus TaxID=68221 RepID=A0A918QNI6_9ACTN|nr:RraA family protein [Streptomyces inusitatus]GGZ57085.1 demethylmenaquinone methyltransferase [Streptomyces inusitatus]